MKYYLGIDTGTTSISLAAIDESHRLIEHRTLNHSSFMKGEPHNRIQDPERIMSLTLGLLDELTQKLGLPSGIGFTGQMHGMLYVNSHGDSVSPLYTWEDQSGTLPLEGTRNAVDILRSHGMSSSAGYGLATHLYLQKSGRVPSDAVRMTTISDYIAMKLAGNHEPVLSSDMAASWGCFDVRAREFMTDALSDAGVNVSYLPRVVNGYAVIGRTRDGVPVMCSMGDNQASVRGSVRDEGATLLLNVGTGSQVSMVTGEYVHASGNIEIRPYDSDRYILAGSSLCGGRAYAMLEGFYREVAGHEYYGTMLAQAEEFIRTQGLANAWEVRTTFSGTREDANMTGSVAGITSGNFCAGAFTVGVIRGILEELHGFYESMRDMTGREARVLSGSGNGLRKNELMQRLASELFGMELYIPEHTEEAAFGAAVCAMNRV